MAPVEAAAENALDDQVVGCRGWPNAYADVDLPFGRDVEVGDGEDLLLLVVETVPGADAATVLMVWRGPSSQVSGAISSL